MAKQPTKTHAEWIGEDVYDSSGSKIGSVKDVYYDDITGRPDWITVSTGLFGTACQFVPISGTSMTNGNLHIGFTKDLVKDAPAIDDDGHLTPKEERRLYAHYKLDFDASADADLERPRADVGYGYSQGDAKADASVTRSEEEVSVDKVKREADRVRLRKYVVTEDVNFTVPVRKEVARVTRETLDGKTGGTITGDVEEEVVLKEEEVVVGKQVAEKERIGLETETVTEDRTVSETVRKEQVEVDGNVDQTKKR